MAAGGTGTDLGAETDGPTGGGGVGGFGGMLRRWTKGAPSGGGVGGGKVEDNREPP
jgi:hypothetical protein